MNKDYPGIEEMRKIKGAAKELQEITKEVDRATQRHKKFREEFSWLFEDDAPDVIEKETTFEEELRGLINKYSLENGSDTPDFVLASYLTFCLDAFHAAVNNREKFYSRL